MPALTPDQRRTRARTERLIRLMAPGLSLVLFVGDRVSRLLEPVDHEYYPTHTAAGEPPPPRPPEGGDRR